MEQLSYAEKLRETFNLPKDLEQDISAHQLEGPC